MLGPGSFCLMSCGVCGHMDGPLLSNCILMDCLNQGPSPPLPLPAPFLPSAVDILLRRYFLHFKEPRNRFQGIDSSSLCSLTGGTTILFLLGSFAPIDCSKSPALYTYIVPPEEIQNTSSFYFLCWFVQCKLSHIHS